MQIAGGEQLELRVTLDTEKLSACGLSVVQVLKKLGDANVKVPVGVSGRGYRRST